MEIKIEKEEKAIKAVLNGNIDSSNDKELSKALMDIRKIETFDHVSFDMTNVHTITSSGIGRLLNFFKFLDTTDRTMEIRGISNLLYQQFTEIHLERIFPILKEK
jgi:anti-sigma B factor antagonist